MLQFNEDTRRVKLTEESQVNKNGECESPSPEDTNASHGHTNLNIGKHGPDISGEAYPCSAHIGGHLASSVVGSRSK